MGRCGGQYALYRPATRQEDRGFRYQALSFRPYGPFHPIQGKVAAIGITRGGVVSTPGKRALGTGRVLMGWEGENVVSGRTRAVSRGHDGVGGVLESG